MCISEQAFKSRKNQALAGSAVQLVCRQQSLVTGRNSTRETHTQGKGDRLKVGAEGPDVAESRR